MSSYKTVLTFIWHTVRVVIVLILMTLRTPDSQPCGFLAPVLPRDHSAHVTAGLNEMLYLKVTGTSKWTWTVSVGDRIIMKQIHAVILMLNYTWPCHPCMHAA